MDKGTLGRIGMLFVKNGYRTLTVDQIAKELNISKKTIYKYYKSKKEIILDSMKQLMMNNFMLKYKEIMKEESNPIAGIVKYRLYIMNQSSIVNERSNLNELKKYYPSIYQQVLKICMDWGESYYQELLTAGKKEGYIKENLDINSTIHFYVTSQLHLRTSTPDNESTNFQEIENTMFYIFLNGIVTEKGRQELKNHDVLKHQPSQN